MAVNVMPVRKVTGFYYIGADVALKTLVAPAANTKGVLITAAACWCPSSSSRSRIMSKPSAPASVDDTTALTIAYSHFETNGAPNNLNGAVLPCILPPGLGLFAQKDTANSTAGYLCDYEVLL